jgi:hypothetical protein
LNFSSSSPKAKAERSFPDENVSPPWIRIHLIFGSFEAFLNNEDILIYAAALTAFFLLGL